MHLAQLAHLLTFLWLFCLMLQIGLSVTLTQVWASMKHGKVLLKGLGVNFSIVPLTGFGLLLLFTRPMMIISPTWSFIQSPMPVMSFLSTRLFSGSGRFQVKRCTFPSWRCTWIGEGQVRN